MGNADSNLATGISRTRQCIILLLLCLLAAAHVFVFSAAFPFFNNVDEQIHFDLAVKCSQGHILRALEPVSDESVRYIVLYGSPEYLGITTNSADGQLAPPWKQPLENVRQALITKTASWRTVTNYEASQPPLYYTLAGLWWRLGEACGFHDGLLLYWLRFLNVLFVVTLIWLGFVAARMIFPDNLFLQFGVPALIAFMPQTAFYSIQNDVLSPVCFGAAFILLLRWLQSGGPGRAPGDVRGPGAGGDVPDQNQQPAAAGRRSPGRAAQNMATVQERRPARSEADRTVARGLRRIAGCALARVVQIHLRRFHRLGGENQIPRLDAQAVRRVVAPSDFHVPRILGVSVRQPGHAVAGRISCGTASRLAFTAWIHFTRSCPSAFSQ